MNTNKRTNPNLQTTTRNRKAATRCVPVRVLGACVFLVAALVCAPAAFLQQGGQYQIAQAVVAGGGGSSSGGAVTLSGTIGQPVLGLSSGGQFALNAGFWQGAAAPCSSPDFSSQPASQTVCEGAMATFSVDVTGNGIGYQWRKNGVDISGATSSTLTLNNVTEANAASYDVVVSQFCGPNVTSTAATLAVSTYSLAPASAAYPASGGTGSFNLLVDGSCPWTAVSNDPWITIIAPPGGAATGTNVVSYSVASSSAGRTGTVTVAGKTFTVTQTAPTAITLVGLTAASFDKGVLLEWQTAFEVDNLGFNLHRDEFGKRTLVNQQLINGSALTAGIGVAVHSGFTYQWWDSPVDSKAVQYWLEAIDLDGRSAWHGPFPVEAADTSRQNAFHNLNIAQTLSNLGNCDSPSRQLEPRAKAGASTIKDLTPPSSNSVKIEVKRAGIYRVTQSDLIKAGLDTAADPRTIKLFVDGREQPIRVSGEQDGSFDPPDAIEFYGVGIDSPFTDAHNYFLVHGKQTGRRISSFASPAKPTPFGSFAFTTERRDRSIYFAGLLNGERENFFGAVLTSQSLEQSMTIQHLDTTSSVATLEVGLQGVTHVPHNVTVLLNGSTVGHLNYNGQANHAAVFSINHGLLVEGPNIVTLQTAGNPADLSLVDYLRLTYQHRFTADDDELRFKAQGGQQITIDGFTDDAIRVFDVTDGDAVQELVGWIEKDLNSFRVSVQTRGSGERSFIAITDSTIKHPEGVRRRSSSSLPTAAQMAQVVIITHQDLLGAAQALKSLRTAQGLSVAVVDIEAVFDQYSFGQKTPYAVKDFIDYARKNCQLSYVLLMGDASYDAKNYLRLGNFDLVPTKLIDTTFLEAASDEWLADFDNDGIADLAIGRLPVRTPVEAERMVKKLVSYDQAKPSNEVLGVADLNDGYNFEDAIDRLQPLIPADMNRLQVKRGQVGDAPAKGLLMEALNRGQKIATYAGHGSTSVWRGNLLTDTDAGQLQNRERLSVFLMMNCLNGYFADPQRDSLSEALLKAEGGAVAVWASTALTYPESQTFMSQELYRQLFGDRQIRIGDAVMRARAAAFDMDVRRTWVLFGDPTMRLR